MTSLLASASSLGQRHAKRPSHPLALTDEAMVGWLVGPHQYVGQRSVRSLLRAPFRNVAASNRHDDATVML